MRLRRRPRNCRKPLGCNSSSGRRSTGAESLSVYFETPSATLRAAGISLRVRRIDDETVQTVKCGGGAFKRQEWEWEIAGDKPDFDLARDTVLTQFNLKKLSRKLHPVFETDVERAAIPMRTRLRCRSLASLQRRAIRLTTRSQS